MSIELSTLDTSLLTLGSFSFEKKLASFESKPSNFLASTAFKLDKKPVNITFPAILISDRIYCSNEYKTESYSLSVELEDDQLLDQFSEISTIIADIVGDGWTQTEIVKDDKIYLKIKFNKNGKSPLFKCNVPMNSKKLSDVNIYQGQKVQVSASLKAYFNFEAKQCGSTIAISELLFEQQEPEIEDLQTPKQKQKEATVPDAPRKKAKTE
jgi:hypothetical protein